jgi:hypothetical protein
MCLNWPLAARARWCWRGRGELDAVLSRFRALLRISELEASNRRAGFASLDMAALAGDVCELYEPLAEERASR